MPPSRKSRNDKKEKTQKRSIKKRKFYTYSQDSLKEALREIRENGLPIREASKRFGVPRTTIQNRIHGRIKDIARKTDPEPFLTNEGEQKIVHWIKNMPKCGFPLKKSDLMETVTKILKDSKKESLFKGGKPGQRQSKRKRKITQCHIKPKMATILHK